MTTIFIIVVLIASAALIFKSFSAKKEETATEIIEKKIAAIRKENDKENKYPKFIPFYEWHGFLKGLHPENRRYVLTNGKQGKKPKKWSNDK